MKFSKRLLKQFCLSISLLFLFLLISSSRCSSTKARKNVLGSLSDTTQYEDLSLRKIDPTAWLQPLEDNYVEEYDHEGHIIQYDEFIDSGKVLLRRDKMNQKDSLKYIFQKALSEYSAIYSLKNKYYLFKFPDHFNNVLYISAKGTPRLTQVWTLETQKVGKLTSQSRKEEVDKWLSKVKATTSRFHDGKLQFSSDGMLFILYKDTSNIHCDPFPIYLTKVESEDQAIYSDDTLTCFYESLESPSSSLPYVLHKDSAEHTPQAHAWLAKVKNKIASSYADGRRTDSYSFSKDGFRAQSQLDTTFYSFQEAFTPDSAFYRMNDSESRIFYIKDATLWTKRYETDKPKKLGQFHTRYNTREACAWFKYVQGKIVYNRVADSPYEIYYVFSGDGRKVTCFLFADGIKIESYTYDFCKAEESNLAEYQNKGDCVGFELYVKNRILLSFDSSSTDSVCPDLFHRQNLYEDEFVDFSPSKDSSDSDDSGDSGDSDDPDDSDDLNNPDHVFDIGHVVSQLPDTLHPPVLKCSNDETNWLSKVQKIGSNHTAGEEGYYDGWSFSLGGRCLVHYLTEGDDEWYNKYPFWFSKMVAPGKAEYTFCNVRNGTVVRDTIYFTKNGIQFQ